MIQIKLSSVTIVVLLLYFIFRMMNLMRVKFNHFLIISLPSILLSIVWILKQYITTGCFIYPVSISCINNLVGIKVDQLKNTNQLLEDLVTPFHILNLI